MNNDRPNGQPNDGGYDRLAWWYPCLETMMFGRRLAETRRDACLHFVDTIDSPRSVLLLGDGRGQCLDFLVRQWHQSDFVSIDRSGRMLDYQRRSIPPQNAGRVVFRQADALERIDPPNGFDVVVMAMFADCFSPARLERLLENVDRCLNANGVVAHLDFVTSKRAIDRGRMWAMHRFFGLATDLEHQSLIDIAPTLQSLGFERESRRSHLGDFAQSSVFGRRGR